MMQTRYDNLSWKSTKVILLVTKPLTVNVSIRHAIKHSHKLDALMMPSLCSLSIKKGDSMSFGNYLRHCP